MNVHDIIVLGGGPNGLATALALAGRRMPNPLKVLVLDARDPSQIPDDSRGTALTRATQAMFSALGVWDELAAHATAMARVLVTDGEGDHQSRSALLTFDTHPQEAASASLVENQQLYAALLTEVQNSPCIHLEGGFRFVALKTEPGKIIVESETGHQHAARLLAAADGRHSKVREALGFKVTSHDYRQTALSFAIRHSLPHDLTAEEHFSSDGVFAVLPLKGNRSSIVWGMNPQQAEELLNLPVPAFNHVLQTRMGKRLGEVALEGLRGSFPLVMQIAQHTTAPRVVLLGDAAHAIHPLAGLGLNLGFKDAAALADSVAKAIYRGEDLGGAAVLERYEQARRFDTLATSLAMDGMNGIFVNNNPVLQPLRQLGLRLVDHWPIGKAYLMDKASGLSPENPRLLQGLFPG